MGLAELAALYQVVKDVYKETDFRGRVKELVEKRALKKELLNKIILKEQECSRIDEEYYRNLRWKNADYHKKQVMKWDKERKEARSVEKN